MAFEYDLSGAQFLCGPDFKYQHGVYPGVLRSTSFRGAQLASDTRLVLWYPPKADGYPTMHQYMLTGNKPNGGVLMDLDHGHVATFGVYDPVGKGTFKLLAWYDFDHWPVIGAPGSGNILAPGLADGHFHAAPKTADQHPVNSRHRQMLMQVIAHAMGSPPT